MSVKKVFYYIMTVLAIIPGILLSILIFGEYMFAAHDWYYSFLTLQYLLLFLISITPLLSLIYLLFIKNRKSDEFKNKYYLVFLIINSILFILLTAILLFLIVFALLLGALVH